MIKKKMKIKDIIWWGIGLLFFIIIIIPSINLILAHNLKDNKPEISRTLYEANLRYPSKFMKDESLYKLSENIMGGFGRYNIFMMARLGNSLIDQDDVSRVIESYEEILKNYPKSSYYDLSYQKILDSYIYMGDYKQLMKWIEWGSYKDNEDINKISNLYKGYNYLTNREYDEAENLLKDYDLENERLDYIYYFLKGHIEFMKEDFNKALEYYEMASEISWQYKTSFFGNYDPTHREHWLKELRYKEGDNRIEGRVTVDGVGVPFVEVYLQYPRDGYFSRGGNFIAITDKDGYFETIGIKDGEYEIGIGIGTPNVFDKVYLEKEISEIDLSQNMEFDFEFIQPMEVISPKVDEEPKDKKFIVEWEEVKGADYYTIQSIGYDELGSNVGSNTKFPIYDENGEEKIRDTKAIFNIEDLNSQGMGLIYMGEEDITITPQGILGYFGPGSNMTIIVNSHNEDGDILNSNLPVVSYNEDLPSIKVPEKTFSEGEKLILSRRYEEAIDYYEYILSGDENNIESLKYLYRIYLFGWKAEEDNIEKGIEYGEKLYKITGDLNIIRVIEDTKNRK